MNSNENKIQQEKVLISILNWKNYSDTINCIEQLVGFGFEGIIVIDNASPNNSVKEIKTAFPDLEVIESNINTGFAAGHKIAADHALKNNFDLLWILNPDVIINENTLPELVQAYKRNGQAIYGSFSVNENDPNKIEFGGAYEIKAGKPQTIYNFQKNKSLAELRNISKDIQVGAVEGFSMLIPVEVIRKHGFMDTSFFMYGEETDYCLWLWEKGIPSYIVTGSAIIHKGEGSFNKSEGAKKVTTYYRTRNYRLIAKKYFGLTNSEILKSVGGIIALLRFFIKWNFAGKNFKKEKDLDYFHNLGILHALFGIKGKKISPEKYL